LGYRCAGWFRIGEGAGGVVEQFHGFGRWAETLPKQDSCRSGGLEIEDSLNHPGLLRLAEVIVERQAQAGGR
jgi:hypothetical protein